jgi:hypothetical protein
MKDNFNTNLATIKEIFPNIYHFHFFEQVDLTSTFIRVSEYFEGPLFRKKVFSIEKFMKLYSKKFGGPGNYFTYYTDWSGFNMPSWALAPFVRGDFNPLTPKEKALIDVFKDRSVDSKYYVIGTSADDKEISVNIRHELAHALFYLNKEYKREVRKIIRELKINKKPLEASLKKVGYLKASFEDECHAYLLDGKKGLDILRVRNNKRYREAYELLNKNFDSFIQITK